MSHNCITATMPQAMSLLKAISEPLISLEAGRLTRKLSSPTKLQPTEERGVLSLWLLPNDDLALCWQTSVQAPAAAGAAGEGRQAGCNVAVWEALAHFPEGCFYDSDEPGAPRGGWVLGNVHMQGSLRLVGTRSLCGSGQCVDFCCSVLRSRAQPCTTGIVASSIAMVQCGTERRAPGCCIFGLQWR